MNKKDSLAILGILFHIGNSVYYEGKFKHDSIETLLEHPECAYDIINYLSKLKLSYNFVKDILTDEYGSAFYHKEMGCNSKRLPKKYNKEELYTSEHDGQIWFDDKGRLGVWCEVDGFVSWLDEYKKVWVVDSRKEVKERRRKLQEEFDKRFKPLIEKSVEKCFSEPLKRGSVILLDGGEIKIAKMKVDGLVEYKKPEDK